MTRCDFAKMIDIMDLMIGVEVGVGMGDFSVFLLENSSIHRIYGIENWHVRWARKAMKRTKEKMKKFGDSFRWVEKPSLQAATEFSDGYFDFVYIDANHHRKPCLQDIEAFWPKCRDGGLFAGHDYVVAPGCGVAQAVDSFFRRAGRSVTLTDDITVNPSWWVIK